MHNSNNEQVDSGTGLFKKALKVTCTTAEGSASSTGDDSCNVGHYLEAQDTIASFWNFGTSDAKSFTLSFYVKAVNSNKVVIQMYCCNI